MHAEDQDDITIDLSEADPAYHDHFDWDEFERSIQDDDEPTIAPLIVGTRTSWAELDAAALLSGDLDEAPPEFLERDDGPCLLYRGKVHSFAGEPESGKGWLALLACLDVMQDGGHVVYVDFEDTPQGLVNRLRLLGVPASTIIEQFHYVRPTQPIALDGPTFKEFFAVMHRAYEARGALGLIVFDGITEALALQGIESKDNDSVAAWFAAIPRRFAHALQAAVVLIDHVTKSADDRGRYAIGAQAKLSAIDGCQYLVEQRMAFARGRSGVARVFVSKDRPGHVRAHAAGVGKKQIIGDLMVTALDDGQLRLALVAPDLQVNDDGTVRPTGIQNEIVKYLRRVKGGRGRQEILDRVKGRAQTKRAAFNDMVDNGWLVDYKEGRKTLYKIGTPQDEVAARPEDVT